MSSEIWIAPSLLAADFGRVKEEVQRCVEAGADLLHLDLMDGHFVPNLSYGFPILKALAEDFPELRLDVHLMVSNPEDYVERLVALKAYQITVHWEASHHIHRLLGSIRDQGVKAGLAFNPHTPIEGARSVANLVDCYLVMTVNPGFGGQSFLHSQLQKVRMARSLADSVDHECRVSVDGGVDHATAALCRDAGACLLVAGSYLFRGDDMTARLAGLRG